MPGLKCLKPSLENFCGTCWNSVRTKHIQSIQEFKYFKYSKYSNIQSNQNRPQRIFCGTCWNSAQSKKPSSFLSNFLKAASTRLSLWRAYKLYIRTIIQHPHHHHQHHHHHHRQNIHNWINRLEICRDRRNRRLRRIISSCVNFLENNTFSCKIWVEIWNLLIYIW